MNAKLKKGIIGTAMLGILASAGFAVWLINWNDDVDVEVISDGSTPLSATMTFSDMTFNTTLVAVTNTSTARMLNADGALNMTVSINETIVDVTTDSCDNSGDLNASWEINGAPVADGNVVELPSGVSEVNMTLSAKQFSCPQNFSGQISLTATG